ncbi:hypothetical protein [Magnetospirillum fulvum]|uniref:Uncharacterized protein n=1 Tax=Magnetospirillum fulvum MGU-K5 TaxID=1316936 RepID=S9S8C7_MAGFU|nr:hypothetical protein [Magnetospirillum fulvum]EPY00929.1 hypothetical protein K678_13623 [Magnetospirillum fulvum MGU-K5]
MTLAALNVLSFGAVGDAFGQWCRVYSAKDLMALFGVAEQTAKKWRTGKLPEPKHLVAMTQYWGEDFLLCVFAPVLRQTDSDLLGDLAAIERRVALIRQRVTHESHRSQNLRASARALIDGADGAGGPVGAADPMDQYQDRAADGAGASAIPSRSPLIRTLAGVVMMVAALHEPLSVALGEDGALWARTSRVHVARGPGSGRVGRWA